MLRDKYSEENAYSNDMKDVVEIKVKPGSKAKVKKLYKISYQLNLLTSMSSEDGQLMSAIAESDELAIFNCDVVRDCIDYKWQKFGRLVHVRGLIFHTIYIIVLSLYIKVEYLHITVTQKVPNKSLLGGIAVCLIYPLLYDGTQMVK